MASNRDNGVVFVFISSLKAEKGASVEVSEHRTVIVDEENKKNRQIYRTSTKNICRKSKFSLKRWYI